MNEKVAIKLHSLINIIENASNLYDINSLRIYNLHPLKGDMKGKFALDLGRKEGFRLVITPLDSNYKEMNENDINVLYKSTKIIIVMEVSNHYE